MRRWAGKGGFSISFNICIFMKQKNLLRKYCFPLFSSVNFVLEFFGYGAFANQKRKKLSRILLAWLMMERKGEFTLRMKGAGFRFCFRFLGFWAVGFGFRV